jgi:acyl carrier protein
MSRLEIRALIHRCLSEVAPQLKNLDLTEETALPELGLDSLKLIEVGVRLEDAFGDSVRFDNWLEQERTKQGNSAFKLASLISFIEERRAA